LEDVGHGGMKVEEVGDMTEVEVMTEMEVMTNIKNDVRKDMQDDSNVRKLSSLFYNPLALASAKD